MILPAHMIVQCSDCASSVSNCLHYRHTTLMFQCELRKDLSRDLSQRHLRHHAQLSTVNQVHSRIRCLSVIILHSAIAAVGTYIRAIDLSASFSQYGI